MAGESIQEQTRQCLKNVQAIFEAVGISLDDAVSAKIIVAEENDFTGMNEEWGKWFPKDPPARQGAKPPIRQNGIKISIALSAGITRFDRSKGCIKRQMKFAR